MSTIITSDGDILVDGNPLTEADTSRTIVGDLTLSTVVLFPADWAGRRYELAVWRTDAISESFEAVDRYETREAAMAAHAMAVRTVRKRTTAVGDLTLSTEPSPPGYVGVWRYDGLEEVDRYESREAAMAAHDTAVRTLRALRMIWEGR